MKHFVRLLVSTVALVPVAAAAGPVLAKLSVLPLTDPIATQITGAGGVANYIAQGFDASFFFENTSSTLFTNNRIRIVRTDGSVSEGTLGNIGPGQVLPGFSYPIASFELFAWDGIVEGVRGRTEFPRPETITFTSDQTLAVTLNVTAPYDSVEVIAIPEPSILSLVAIASLATAVALRRQRSV